MAFRTTRSRTAANNMYDKLIPENPEEDEDVNLAIQNSLMDAQSGFKLGVLPLKKVDMAKQKLILATFRRADHMESLAKVLSAHFKRLIQLSIVMRRRLVCLERELRNEVVDMIRKCNTTEIAFILRQVAGSIDRNYIQPNAAGAATTDPLRTWRNIMVLQVIQIIGCLFECYFLLGIHNDPSMVSFVQAVFPDLYKLLKSLQQHQFIPKSQSSGSEKHIHLLILKILTAFHSVYDFNVFNSDGMKMAITELAKTSCESTDYKTSLLYGTLLCYLWQQNQRWVEQLFDSAKLKQLLPKVREIFIEHDMDLNSFYPPAAYAIADLLSGTHGIHRSFFSFNIVSAVHYSADDAENVTPTVKPGSNSLSTNKRLWLLTFSPKPHERIYFEVCISSNLTALIDIPFCDINVVECEAEEPNSCVINLEFRCKLEKYIDSDSEVDGFEAACLSKSDSIEFTLSTPTSDIIVMLEEALNRSFGTREVGDDFVYTVNLPEIPQIKLSSWGSVLPSGKRREFSSRDDEADMFEEDANSWQESIIFAGVNERAVRPSVKRKALKGHSTSFDEDLLTEDEEDDSVLTVENGNTPDPKNQRSPRVNGITPPPATLIFVPAANGNPVTLLMTPSRLDSTIHIGTPVILTPMHQTSSTCSVLSSPKSVCPKEENSMRKRRNATLPTLSPCDQEDNMYNGLPPSTPPDEVNYVPVAVPKLDVSKVVSKRKGNDKGQCPNVDEVFLD